MESVVGDVIFWQAVKMNVLLHLMYAINSCQTAFFFSRSEYIYVIWFAVSLCAYLVHAIKNSVQMIIYLCSVLGWQDKLGIRLYYNQQSCLEWKHPVLHFIFSSVVQLTDGSILFLSYCKATLFLFTNIWRNWSLRIIYFISKVS